MEMLLLQNAGVLFNTCGTAVIGVLLNGWYDWIV
jgi:hypothetical protein